MHVVRELDAGDIILKLALPIAADETGGSLHDRLAEIAPTALAESLAVLADGRAARIPQDQSASCYISKLERDHGRLDWTQGAVNLERRVRAYDPWPGTFTLALENGQSKRLKIFPPTTVVEQNLAPGELLMSEGKLLVGCGGAALRLEFVQPEGGRKMAAADYFRGRSPTFF